MQSFAWYVNRLRRMSVAEIAHRVGRSARELGSWLESTEVSAPAILPASATAARSWISTPEDIDAALYRRAANRILQGRYSVFHLRDVELGRPPRWNRDPLTGIEAPLQRATSLDYRDQTVVGNIKYLWEPNRHLHLVTLAQAYALTRDESYTVEIKRQIESWIEQCPYSRGPNWASSLELGIRLINWSICWQLLSDSHASILVHDHGEFRVAWLKSVFLHVRRIVRNLSRYSSANNHLIGELAAVFIASMTWPHWHELRVWGAQSKESLEREALKQNARDGGNREQAMSYQQFVLDFLLFSGLAARSNGADFSREYWARVEAMIDFVASMMDVAGHIPMIGDADDGFVASLSQDSNFCPYHSLIATGAQLFDRPDLAAKAQFWDHKSRWLDAEKNGAEKFATLRAKGRSYQPKRAFPESGYFILGERLETPDEVRLIVDAGPLGYLRLAAHGHADCLAILLNVAGDEVLIDPGTFCYHTDPEWRRYFRGTSSHNTVSIDDRDQSIQSGNFMWSDHAAPREVEFRAEQVPQRFVGAHNGYCRLKDPAIHRREIRYDLQQCAFEILDTIQCDGPHEVVRHWHFAENLEPVIAGGLCTVRTALATVRLEALESLDDVSLFCGVAEPPGGWVSRSFGTRVPTHTLRWRNDIRGTTIFRSRIACRIVRAGA